MKRRLQSATDRRRRTRNPRRAILTALGLTLAMVAVPSSASAAVRTGSVQDPQGDASALSGPVLDLKSLAVRYDDALGTVRLTWTYYNDIRTGSEPMHPLGGGFGMAAPVAQGLTDQAFGGWSGSTPGDGSWSLTGTLQMSGTSGMLPGNVTMGDDGRSVTAEFTSPMLAGRDFQRAPNGPTFSGDSYDAFWFDGFADPGPPINPPPAKLPPTSPTPINIPAPGASDGRTGMTINDGAQYTNDPDVTLSVVAPSWADTLRVANDGGFRPAETFPVKKTIRWRLAESGPERLPKTVYLRFGREAQNFTDDIILDQTKPTVSSATVDASGAATTATVAQTAASETPTYRVRIRAKDATSGVAKVQFARNKKHPSSLRKFARTTRYKAARAPKYLRVQDRAGNFSRWRPVR
jgi:hypothetical protein